jgi:cytochrome o ubiquinol oxidase subunit II
LALLTLSGCSGGVLDPKGPVGAGDALILLDSLGIMLLIVVPVVIVTLAFAWWFRESNTKARYLPNWAHSGRIELVVWSIPTLTIMFLGGVAWISSAALDPARSLGGSAKPLDVQVVSLDWKWLFIYPEQGVASVNQLVLPVDVPVHFSLTSASVLNVFFVPQLGSMIYTMNGMTTQLNLQADKPGVFHGESAHFSGDGFAGMAFDTHAVSPSEFDSWIATARNSGPTLDSAEYAKLAQQSENVKPYTYRAVRPQLFDAVVAQELAPGPGPDLSKPHATVSPRTRQ